MYLFFLWLLFFSFYKFKSSTLKDFDYSFKNCCRYAILLLTVSFVVVILFRGGFQLVPIQMTDAHKKDSYNSAALILNSPFVIIKSLENGEIKELNLMKDCLVKTIIRPEKHFTSGKMNKKNIVIIILESFGKEFTHYGNSESYTPFFDSLASNGLVFTNAWANGTRSIEGIPAIISSMPHLMETPYINSVYCTNQLNSIASTLKKFGYRSAFFHGGANGTMNFDTYTKSAGFDFYFGKNEYNNENDFDGVWGIYDEPFMRFSAIEMNKLREPFCSVLFTLSSHFPYKIPNRLNGKFKKDSREISESIGYADYSLKQFFHNAKKFNWFKNTLFVITADHAAKTNAENKYAIPVAFFDSKNQLLGRSNRIMQQTDIMPSLLYLVGYNKPFFSFGNNVFDSISSKYSTVYEMGNYIVKNDSSYFVFNNFTCINAYKKSDKAKSDALSLSDAEIYFKSLIQTYNNRLIKNKTYCH